MAKKTRQPNLPPSAFNITHNAAPRSEAAPAASSAPAPQARAVAAPAKSATVNWQAEYGEVLGDLKLTGLLAAGLLAVMVALSFFI
ncbi:MAG: hypothetical protein KIH69_016170 [Anaerolineae bacterium]|nr:hypothetical protein [Anaerolineae bacterium]